MNSGTKWLTSGTGRDLLREEAQQVAAALDSVFGDQLIQLGVWGGAGQFRRFARTRRMAVAAAAPVAGVDLVTEPDDLAIASDSVDAVLLPHVLENAEDPHAILREVDRVLRPDGQVIALGFNPVGWWGLRHLVARRPFPPGARHLISQHRLCDWLKLLSFQVSQAGFYFYAAPVLRRRPKFGPGRSAVTDAGPPVDGAAPATHRHEAGLAGSLRRSAHGLRARLRVAMRRVRRQQVFAACYIVVARKEVFVMTPIRPLARRRARLVGGLVNPTTRTAA